VADQHINQLYFRIPHPHSLRPLSVRQAAARKLNVAVLYTIVTIIATYYLEHLKDARGCMHASGGTPLWDIVKCRATYNKLFLRNLSLGITL
jgi:hypothetical protein